jgi:hypothetical protein
MDEVMTIAEIEEQFDSEWVLVGDPEVDEQFHVIRGRVLWHSKDRDEVYRKMVELRPTSSATLCTGKIPDDMVIVL